METKKYPTPIKASKLIELLETSEIESEVVDDEDCYPQIFSAEVEADSDGHCSITCQYGYREDSPRYGVSLGRVEFEVEGVRFSASRDCDGGIERYEIEGREIEYDNDLTEDDVVSAAEENVEYCGYDPDCYCFEESEVSDDDIIDAIDSQPEVFAEDEDGGILGFDDESEIPEGCTRIDADDAIRRLVERRDDVSFEL